MSEIASRRPPRNPDQQVSTPVEETLSPDARRGISTTQIACPALLDKSGPAGIGRKAASCCAALATLPSGTLAGVLEPAVLWSAIFAKKLDPKRLSLDVPLELRLDGSALLRFGHVLLPVLDVHDLAVSAVDAAQQLATPLHRRVSLGLLLVLLLLALLLLHRGARRLHGGRARL